jgi:hypothetical protein
VPTGHIAAVALVEPTAHTYPAEHAPEQPAVVRPAPDPYLPPGHGVQDPTPPSLYVPALQRDAVGEVDPAAHAYPAEHAPEQPAVVRPSVAPYLPAGHGLLQATVDRPDVDPYKPTAQLLQEVAPDRLNVPTGQITAVALVEPTGHEYPAEQGPEQVHDTWPGVDPYLPPGHCAVHDAVVRPVVSPYSPGLHMLHDAAPDRLYVPSGHIAAVALMEPTAHAYPAEHAPEHASVIKLASDPYLPPGHGVQDPVLASRYAPDTHWHRGNSQDTRMSAVNPGLTTLPSDVNRRAMVFTEMAPSREESDEQEWGKRRQSGREQGYKVNKTSSKTLPQAGRATMHCDAHSGTLLSEIGCG